MAEPVLYGKVEEGQGTGAQFFANGDQLQAGEVALVQASDCSRCCCCLRFTSRDPRATKGGSMGYLLLVLIGWMIAVLSVYLSRNSFPTPQPADSTTFSEERARKILLSVQATGAHPVLWSGGDFKATSPNIAIFNLFRDEILRIQADASQQVQVELQVPSTGSVIRNSSYFDYIAARLRVSNAHYPKAMLLTAHFDSAVPDGVPDSEWALPSMGDGMADDGVGCAAVLETFRVLATAQEPPLVDVILLLTNAEERGFVGLDSFMSHSPWATDVSFFVQMDQSGSRGHALAVFGDAMSGERVAAFAYHAGAVHPHTSVLLRDFQPWEDMSTDGVRLRSAYGIPGIGMYMMEDRCPYHTVYDTLEHIMPGNLQHHGDNFVGISNALTRNEEILASWANGESDLSGDAYSIDLLSSSMLLLTSASMGVLYGFLTIATLTVTLCLACLEPKGTLAALADTGLLALAHFVSIVFSILVSFAISLVVTGNWGYWYERDGMAIWLYVLPCFAIELLFGRVLLLRRFHGLSPQQLQWRSTCATLVLFVPIALALALAGLHLSILFAMCILTRLSGFTLRVLLGVVAALSKWGRKDGCTVLVSRSLGESLGDAFQVFPYLPWAACGATLELSVALLGSIYLLDAMRFAVLNFTTSFGVEGDVLGGELTLGLYCGLFGSLAIMQSSAIQAPPRILQLSVTV
ncbi:Endoplasmic reticulum metallopeptidase 1 (Felix-ina) [Durusdinium trenchii]|uniref:Endoplasmic reticulum metallopeptidase 1 (Felix-ina) n=2 Tax=Durusdinium trenchii TaxID=1381693 RepID=A0ABP0KME4_9DINO